MEPGPKHQIGSNVLVIFRKYEKKKKRQRKQKMSTCLERGHELVLGPFREENNSSYKEAGAVHRQKQRGAE